MQINPGELRAVHFLTRWPGCDPRPIYVTALLQQLHLQPIAALEVLTVLTDHLAARTTSSLAPRGRLGEVYATARWPDALRRAGPGLVHDRTYKFFQETLRLAGDSERGGPPRAQSPALPRARGGTPLSPTPPPLPPSAPTLGWGPGPTASPWRCRT